MLSFRVHLVSVWVFSECSDFLSSPETCKLESGSLETLKGVNVNDCLSLCPRLVMHRRAAGEVVGLTDG